MKKPLKRSGKLSITSFRSKYEKMRTFHIAARQSEIFMTKHLPAILSTLENLRHFGIFYIIIFDNHFKGRDEKYSDFISRLMHGRFPYYSKSSVKSLLYFKDNYKVIPLRMALQNRLTISTPDLLQCFVKSKRKAMTRKPVL